MMDLTYSLFKLLKKDNISLLYQGDFTNPVLGRATDLIKNHAEDEVGFKSLGNRLSFLMIESFQNIVRYADTHRAKDLHLADELFITRNIGDVFYISTSNVVENDKIGIVKGKLNSVNKLDEKELKELYLNILKNKEFSEKGGAGLGFIEMIRKSKEKLDFNFERVNDDLSIFHFQIKIKSKLIKKIEPEDIVKINETKKIHKLISKEKILLIHKGIFNEKTTEALLAMAEDNTKDEPLTQRRKVFHMVVEILQNISKHSFLNDKNEKEGIFILSEEGDNFIVNGGNFIQNKNSIGLKKYLKNLSQMSKKQLKDIYLKILRGNGIPEEISGGLGLIDVFRESKKPVEYKFIKINEKISFYTIKIVI